MFQKAKDVVMTIGSSMMQKSKVLYNGFLNKVRDTAQKVKNAAVSSWRSVKAHCVAFVYVAALSLGFLSPAHADVPAGVTTAITAAATDVATVGGAVILVHIGIKVWKWIRNAF